jgi:hypothetical protein
MTAAPRDEFVSEDSGPSFAYLILTHRDPALVEALVARILELSPQGHVVIHHDLTSDDVPWEGKPPSRVHFVERDHIYWGDWSIVEATLRMVKFALEELHADWFVVLSGEHWPAADLRAWERGTVSSGVDALAKANPLPKTLRFGRGNDEFNFVNMFLSRCLLKWVTVRQPRSAVAHRAIGGVWKVSRYIMPLVAIEYSHRRKAWFFGRPRRRGRMRDWEFYKGTQWIAFNARSAHSILHTDPGVTNWFRHGHIPDETYFHTVLRHDEDLVVTTDDVTYVPVGRHRPNLRWMVLKLDELPAIWRSGAPFARKVDPVEQPEVIRALNAEVDRRRAAGPGRDRRAHQPTTGSRLPSTEHESPPDPPACVAIVGMHRSGTSATAGLLVGMGLTPPKIDDLVPAQESNERGHWESESVILHSLKVLGTLGAHTYAPPPPTSGWEARPEFDRLRTEAARWLADTSDGRPVVLKDPRLCMTLPIWKSAVPGPIPALFVLRDPLEVARSLEARDNLPMLLGLALWDRYVRSAALSLEGSPTLVVDYTAMLEDPVKWSDVICGFLQVWGVDLDPDARSVALEFLDTGLRHQKTEDTEYEPLVGAHQEVHAILSERAGSESIWQPPELPPAPPWADYVLQLRREVVLARKELYWTQTSRAYKVVSSAWRLTGGGPSLPEPGNDQQETFDLDQQEEGLNLDG